MAALLLAEDGLDTLGDLGADPALGAGVLEGGTMNMAGNLGSFVTGLAFPYLRQWTGSTTPFFLVGLVGAGLNVLAILAWVGTRPDVAVDARAQAPAVTTRPVAADS